ncbi:MAG: penicillin-binding protein 2 [Paludibacteraceae bacterium]|nr:penicillin-binding protein 2 [Paludibacteraceae bacterium]
MARSLHKQDYKQRSHGVIAFVLFVAAVFVLRLFYLQIIDTSFKDSADSNAFLHKTIYPSRGLIYDRNGKLIVSNQPVYDIMLIMREMHDFDTLSFCNTMGITRAEFDQRIAEIKDRSKNPSYSRYTPQVFMSQLSGEEYGRLQEHLYRYSGTFVQQRVLREYAVPHGAHAIGSIGEVSRAQMEEDPYYKSGDYKGQSGIEKTYEEQLRGQKGVEILLRDVHGRIKGRYRGGERDVEPVAGKNVTVGLDIDLQAYGEKLMEGKLGSIVAIEPASGEILALVSSPSYDPSLLVGRKRSKNYAELLADPHKPLFDRPMMAQYPPGSTFKLVQALAMQQEEIINPSTSFPCYQGYYYTRSRKLGCHSHYSPLDLPSSIQHSCNAYYCYCLRNLLDGHLSKYGSVDSAYNAWRGHVCSLGFGSKLDVDFPNEKGGQIPTSEMYDRIYGKGYWRSSTIISISIGQGEILATPLQTANLAAVIANKGYYYTPHILKAVEGDSIDIKYRTKHYSTIDPKYFDVVQEGMARAVSMGTARIGQIDSIPFCGKTGTAQNPHGKDHSIFIAFAPKDDPKIAIAVYVENAGFGATWAVPIASLMIEKYLKGSISPKREYLEQRMLEAKLYQE